MTEPTTRLFDIGLQPERTALAWRRTALSMGAGGVVALRVFPQLLGTVGYLPAAEALAIAAVVFVAAQVRYRRGPSGWTTPGGGAPGRGAPGGGLPAITAVATVALGLVALVVVLSRG